MVPAAGRTTPVIEKPMITTPKRPVLLLRRLCLLSTRTPAMTTKAASTGPSASRRHRPEGLPRLLRRGDELPEEGRVPAGGERGSTDVGQLFLVFSRFSGRVGCLGGLKKMLRAFGTKNS